MTNVDLYFMRQGSQKVKCREMTKEQDLTARVKRINWISPNQRWRMRTNRNIAEEKKRHAMRIREKHNLVMKFDVAELEEMEDLINALHYMNTFDEFNILEASEDEDMIGLLNECYNAMDSFSGFPGVIEDSGQQNPFVIKLFSKHFKKPEHNPQDVKFLK